MYLFPDSNVAAMLDDLLEKKVIELPECKHPEEMNRFNDPRYCNYHCIVSHPVGKCFVLNELIMKVAQQGQSELDLEDMATTHTTTIVFGSFDPIHLQVTHDHSSLCSSYTTLSVQPLLGASDQNAPTDGEEGWTLVTYKKTRKPRPQAIQPNVKQGRKYCHCNNMKPKRCIKAAKPTYVREPMQQDQRIPIFLHEYFPKGLFSNSALLLPVT
ncbi:hypothetical protein ACFX13_007495 [Malus domestica]